MSPTFRALSNRNYRLYAAGGVVSNTGTWMQRVAQDWLVLQLTDNSGTALGITTGLQFLPMLLLSPYAGLIADRFPKRRLLQVTQLMMAVPAVVLGRAGRDRCRRRPGTSTCWLSCSASAPPSTPRRVSRSSARWSAPRTCTNAVGLNSASFNAGPHRRTGAGRRPHRRARSGVEATGWVIILNGISYAAVIVSLQRMRPEDLDPAGAPSRAARGRSATGCGTSAAGPT